LPTEIIHLGLQSFFKYGMSSMMYLTHIFIVSYLYYFIHNHIQNLTSKISLCTKLLLLIPVGHIKFQTYKVSLAKFTHFICSIERIYDIV